MKDRKMYITYLLSSCLSISFPITFRWFVAVGGWKPSLLHKEVRRMPRVAPPLDFIQHGTHSTTHHIQAARTALEKFRLFEQSREHAHVTLYNFVYKIHEQSWFDFVSSSVILKSHIIFPDFDLVLKSPTYFCTHWPLHKGSDARLCRVLRSRLISAGRPVCFWIDSKNYCWFYLFLTYFKHFWCTSAPVLCTRQLALTPLKNRIIYQSGNFHQNFAWRKRL